MLSMSELKSKPSIITLTTDFGTQDWFVGVMKGVIARIHPNAHIIDITHHIAPGSIRQGAFVFSQSHLWFPKGTIHVVVVDPGVGTSRKAIVLKTHHGYCIGPDNGVFSWALDENRVDGVFEIRPDKLNQETSQTFHGRDLFAPAAAKLARGEDHYDWTIPCHDFQRLNYPAPQINQREITGEILYTDRFGNMVTNLPSAQITPISDRFTLRKNQETEPEPTGIFQTYGLAPPGRRSLITGSTGYLEWAVPNGNAALSCGWKEGDLFHLIPLRKC
jgi:S-adenosylmethionine hydrolase